MLTHPSGQVDFSGDLELLPLNFYLRNPMLTWVIVITTCLSVCHASVLCQNEES